MAGPDGGDVRVHYLWEDNGYKQDPTDSTAKVWGADATLDTNEVSRNGTRVRMPASRTAVDITGANIEGAFAVSFGLTNPWWLRQLRGQPSTSGNDPDGDGTDDNWTHTYNGTPDPFRIIEGYELTTKTRVLEGAVARRAAVDPTVGENIVGVTVEGFYAHESTDSPTDLTTQPGVDQDTLDFGDASFSIDGTVQAIMQNASLTLEWPNANPIPGWGTKFPVDFQIGNFDPTLDYTQINTDPPGTSDIYGSSSTSMQEDIESKPSTTMDFDNGKSLGEINQIVFNGEGSYPDSYGEGGVGDVQSLIEENHGQLVKDVTIEATNGVETPP